MRKGHPTCDSVRQMLEAVYRCASSIKDSKIYNYDDLKHNLYGYLIDAPSLDPPAEYSVGRDVVMASDQKWRDFMNFPEKRARTCYLPYLKDVLYGKEEFLIEETEEIEITNPILSLEVE